MKESEEDGEERFIEMELAEIIRMLLKCVWCA